MNASLAAAADRRRNAASLLSAALKTTKTPATARRWLQSYGATAADRAVLASAALDLLKQIEQETDPS